MRSPVPRSTLLIAFVIVCGGCAGAGVDPGPGAETATQPATTTTGGGALEIHFIDVGQSVSTLLIGPTGETMLVDTGHYHDGGEYVLSYLKRHDVSRIDYLVVSHNDADHIGGNAAIIEYYETEAEGIGTIYDPGIAASTQTYEEYLTAVERYDVTLYETRAGDAIPLEGVDVTVMGPPKPSLEDRARNENSIVLKFEYGQTSFLFTGDAEENQEQYLVETYGDRLDVTVLKAGHHGSRGSTGGALLDAATPKAVVISSAYDSEYGHPHEELLRRLAERKIPAYWTGTHGDVVLRSDGRRVTVDTQRAAPTVPLQLRAGEPIDPGTAGALETRATIPGDGSPARSTTVATDGGANSSAPTLAVASVHADADGDDAQNLGDEYLVFENRGETALDLGGWTVADAAGHTYAFPEGYTLDAGATVTLHTGSGADTESNLYWGAGSPVWNNGGDSILVRDADGERVLEEEY
jgi:competence protein ComEC